MDNKDHIVLSCDTLGTSVPKARQNLQMSSLTLTDENVRCVHENVSDYNNCEDSSEHIQSSEYVNYYDNKSYVLEQLKTEFPEDVLPQSDCSLNTQIHSENKELLKLVAKAEIDDENTEDRLSLNIKEENDYNEYQFIVKTEGLEEQEDVQCKFYQDTLKNGCYLLQNSNKHIKVEINAPVDNEIAQLHRCQYCGKRFDNNNTLLVHISNVHKQEKSRCEICKKQFENVGNLNHHILAFHKLVKMNDHSNLSCSSKENEEDDSKNKVSGYITNYNYGPILECSYEKQYRSPIHLREHQEVIHRPKIPKTNNTSIKCDSCKKSFATKWGLATHRKSVHFEYGRKFECWCGKEFRSPLYLRKHERLIHQHYLQNTTNNRFQCDYCKNFITTKTNLLTHIKILHYDYGKRFDCWCGKQFRSPIHLRKHERNVHQDTVQNTNNGKFQCDYCKFFFKTKIYLLMHIKKFHYDYGKLFDCWCGKQFRSPLDLRQHERLTHKRHVQNTKNCKFQCDYCKTFFTSKSKLSVHIRRLHYDYGKQVNCWCGKQFRSPLHLRVHERRIHNRNVQNTNKSKFQCDYCKKFFKTKSGIMVHIQRLHYDYGKRFNCWCGKQFRSPLYLRAHEGHVHKSNVKNTNNGKFQCDYCKKIFTTRSGLIVHINRLHYDYGKRFDCWCGKQFRSPLDLRGHERIIHKRNVQNTNYVKFQCDYCKIFFTTKSGIVIHIKRVHYDYGKWFDCWCGKQFRSPIQLRIHESLIHKLNVKNTNNGKVQCDYCKKFLTTKPGLLAHIKRLHYDYGKRFNCWCGKQFRSPINLTRHERLIHKRNVKSTNDCKFQCDYCKKFFTTKPVLLVHMMRVHYDYGKRFDCWCGKQFRSPIQLRIHERHIHKRYDQNTTYDRFQCDYCKKFITTKANLLIHIKKLHYDYEKRFDCWCGKQFRSLLDLRGHERLIHKSNVQNTNNVKFQCDYCKNFFRTKSGIMVHIQRLHYDYGKRFDCCCGKQFCSPIQLREHVRLVHKLNVKNTNTGKLQCDYCKKFFTTKPGLLVHIKRVHYDYGKRFDCWCGKQFRSPLHLTVHERLIHERNVKNTNNCKFQCDYCKKFFTSKPVLLVHIMRVHYDYGKRFDCCCGKQFRSPIHLRAHERLIHKCNVKNTNIGKM